VRKLSVLSAIIALGATSSAQAEKVSTRNTQSTLHDWWSMVRNCEARGVRDMWYAHTGNGFYFGPQFTISTWHSNGGGPVLEMGDKGGRPMHAYSIRYIITVAERVLRSQGFLAWPNCYGYL
jgi:hypothetical protein